MEKELNYFHCWICLIFIKFCSLAYLSYLPKNLSDLCATTTFEFTVWFYRKTPRCLIPTDIKSRGMVEQCPSKDSFVCTGLCQHYWSHLPPPCLCGRDFVRGPQLAAATVGLGHHSSSRPSWWLALWCCCPGQSPDCCGTAGVDNPNNSWFSAQAVLVDVTIMKYCPSKHLY